MDLINRDKLLEEIGKLPIVWEYGECVKACYRIIEDAPTVELDESVIQEVLNKRCMTAVANEYLIALHGTRPQGEWIVKTISTFPQYQPDEYICPFCHIIVNRRTNYCPNCGARLEV